MILLTEEDKNWLSSQYPHLQVTDGVISGIFEFTATYDAKSGKFFLGECDGIQLSGSFKITLKERISTAISKLPALYIEGVDPVPSRHINPDRSACLCSPFEEEDFLKPQFQFVRFIQELVIPFLYGQLFYSLKGKWPWQDYAHGSVGLLESYGKINNPEQLKNCLQKLAQDLKVWPKIRAELMKKGNIKGGLSCFCEKGDHRRRCHPHALSGIRQLKIDIKRHGIASNIEEVDKMLENYISSIREFNLLSRSPRPATQAAPRYILASSSSPVLNHF